MSDLWAQRRALALASAEPLAVRMRPRTLDEVAGQHHILAPGKLLRRMIDADALTSIIFHGPPGTGKTSLAEVIALHTRRHFDREDAATVGVARIRDIIDAATRQLADAGQRSILFLDEIHRFSRSQQDVLLRAVERGIITLIGATTENPLFAVNSALVSRSTLFRLEPLSPDDIIAVLKRAIADPDRGYGRLNLNVHDDALALWAAKSDGDARRALTALEVAVKSSQSPLTLTPASDHHDPALRVPLRDDRGDPRRDGDARPGQPQTRSPQGPPQTQITITRAVAEESIQAKALVFDPTGDEHYDLASALIKSVRGSDPHAAVYWLARMLESGEDPRFIARRLAILASEDVGNADPRAIQVAAACWQLIERIGMPEARITLAQTVIYLALAAKSNASYTAIDAAIDDVRNSRTVAVPVSLRDSHAPPAADGSRHGQGYQYAHTEGTHTPDGLAVTPEDYLGVNQTYYHPTTNGFEKLLADRLAHIDALRAKLRDNTPHAT